MSFAIASDNNSIHNLNASGYTMYRRMFINYQVPRNISLPNPEESLYQARLIKVHSVIYFFKTFRRNKTK